MFDSDSDSEDNNFQIVIRITRCVDLFLTTSVFLSLDFFFILFKRALVDLLHWSFFARVILGFRLVGMVRPPVFILLITFT